MVSYMSKFWFFYQNDVTTGPFSTDEIRSKLTTQLLDTKVFIWAKGQKSWLSPEDWEKELPEFNRKLNLTSSDLQTWHVNYEGKEFGPISINELTKFLKSLDSYSLELVNIWAEGAPQWGKVFEFTEVLERLGISRRGHIRVPLNGNLIINKNNIEHITQIMTISLGGCGVKGNTDLTVGDHVKITINTQEFNPPIHCSAEVRFASASEVGIKFINLSLESQNRIIDYIRKFSGVAKPSQPKAA